MRFVLFFFDGGFGFGFLGALEDVVFSVLVFLRTIDLGEMSNLRTGFLVREDLHQSRSDSGSVSFTDTVDADVGVPLRGVVHTSYT